MNPADKRIAEILAEFGEDFQASTWIVPGGKARAILHKCTERMAAQAKITFDPPQVISHALDNVVIVVTGRRGSRVEWSVGEASPKNNKNAYPHSMAEKRGKDRVALKLLDLHGDLYSEDEIDDARPNGAEPASAVGNPTARPNGAEPPAGPVKSSRQAKKDGLWPEIEAGIAQCQDTLSLLGWAVFAQPTLTTVSAAWRDEAREAWGKALAGKLVEECHTPAETRQWGVGYAKDIEAMPMEWINMARQVCSEHVRALKAAQPVEVMA
jgi:hypothetical protein